MKTVVVVVVLLLAGVVALGFYQGWFSFSTANTDQKGSIKFEVDTNKFKQDREKFLGQKGKEQPSDQTGK
jgi:predicted negative regulator of RcsB-dependent stress response